jgi:UDP:flavonoid glycosyltransferase YjiC (YdhE family)
MKKILFTTTAGSGHFQVLSALAQEFITLGHNVKVAAPESFQASIEAAGLEIAAFDDSDKEHPAIAELQAGFASGDPAKIERLVCKIIFGLTNTQAALPRLEKTVKDWGPDLIISESAEVSGGILAAKYSIRHVRATPSLALADKQFIPWIMSGITDLLTTHGQNPEEFEDWLLSQQLLTYFPEAFENPEYTGPEGMHRIRHEGSVLDQSKSEPPLIYVTLGSESSKIGFYPRVVQSILDSLTNVKANILVAVGKDTDTAVLKCDRPNVEIKNWVNQKEVISRASLIICHGGSGTVLDGLAAGIPILVVPLFADQPLNAAEVERTNCGYRIVEADIASELPAKVELALNGQAIGSQAMRQSMATYPSVTELAESLLNSPSA